MSKYSMDVDFMVTFHEEVGVESKVGEFEKLLKGVVGDDGVVDSFMDVFGEEMDTSYNSFLFHVTMIVVGSKSYFEKVTKKLYELREVVTELK